MIRVMHVITGLGVGGAETMLHKLLQELDRRTFESTVAALTTGGALAGAIRALRIPVHSLGMRPGVPNPTAVLRLAQLLRRKRPHVLQTWLYHADLLGVAAAVFARTPALVWNIRGSTRDERHTHAVSTARWCDSSRASPASPTLSLSIRRRELLPTRNSDTARASGSLIPNGFDLEHFRADPKARTEVRRELNLEDSDRLIGLVGRYDPQKNHDAFLRAAALLRAKHKARFLLAGRQVDGSNDLLTSLVAGLGLSADVTLLGERADIPRLTAALDVATCVSTGGEGFPNAIGEAMACEVPVVSTDIGDATAIIGDTGVMVRDATPAAIATAWRAVLDMPASRRRQLGEAARRRISDRYTLKAIAAQYAALYRDLATMTAVA